MVNLSQDNKDLIKNGNKAYNNPIQFDKEVSSFYKDNTLLIE